MVRSATSVWTGLGKSGSGSVTTGSGVISGLPYNFTQRFGEEKGTNPEELIAAAHAGCFAMALAVRLENNGITPEQITATANVTMEKTDAGMTITKSHLVLSAKVPGMDDATFQEHAKGAKEGCPISRLLSPAIEITLEATLA
jgi:osmotically inducible protein OsmC